jgi:hypothetical protein
MNAPSKICGVTFSCKISMPNPNATIGLMYTYIETRLSGSVFKANK